MKVPTCKHCGKEGHYQSFCYQKPKKPTTNSKPLQRRPIRKQGKHAKLWAKTRTKWLRIHQNEWFVCYLCEEMVSRRAMQLDHVESRSRRPDLRYELSNLKPVHKVCNMQKGSLSVAEYKKLQKDIKNI